MSHTQPEAGMRTGLRQPGGKGTAASPPPPGTGKLPAPILKSYHVPITFHSAANTEENGLSKHT